MAVTTERHGWDTTEVVTGGMSAEVAGGLASIVVTILGLANVAPSLMLGIATVIMGAALTLEAAVIAAEYSQGRSLIAPEAVGQGQMRSGLSIQFVGGLAGVILGILALIGINPVALAGVSTVIFGAALAFGSGSVSGLSDVGLGQSTGVGVAPRPLAREAISMAAGTQMLAGFSVMVLGLVSLSGIQSQVVALVALLVVAVSVLLSGSAIGGTLIEHFRSESR